MWWLGHSHCKRQADLKLMNFLPPECPGHRHVDLVTGPFPTTLLHLSAHNPSNQCTLLPCYCTCVYTYVLHMYLGPTEVRRGCQIPWN